ncbi:MAG: N-(5'-phosphoribosyl)anthranilate isomerase [Planctomycetaceae bacterium]|nr:MAG: N-(5'-phosphoribosyl)anthranilate isomerase [Planctomycetaceae bacterium]
MADVWVKVCGVRDVATIEGLATLGVDAVGINLYPGSKRAVDEQTAEELCRRAAGCLEPIGVIVRVGVSEAVRLAAAAPWASLQCHGGESIEWLEAFQAQSSVSLVWAWPWLVDNEAAQDDWVARWRRVCQRGGRVSAVLVDTMAGGQFGGSGRPLPWEALRDRWQQFQEELAAEGLSAPRLILAGGLNPHNVRRAVRTVRPWGVDVAGGVEQQPGVKDLARVAAFVQEAKSAL